MTDIAYHYCRFCAERLVAGLVKNFASCPTFREDIQKKLSVFTSDHINLNLKLLPKSICESCYDSLNHAYLFASKVRKSQIILLELYLQKANSDYEEPTLNKKCPLVEDQLVVNVEEASICEKETTNVRETGTFEKEVIFEEDPIVDSEFVNVDSTENRDVVNQELIIEFKNEDTSENVEDIDIERIDQTDNTTNSEPHLKETVSLHGQQPYECKEEVYSDNDFEDETVEDSPDSLTWGTNLYACKFCDSMFSDINSIREHCKSLHQVCNGFRCRECSVELADFDTFVSHHREHRPELEGFCQFCNMELKSAGAGHVASHGDQLFCKFCGEVFTSANSLREHFVLYVPGAVKNERGLSRRKATERKIGAHTASNMLRALKMHRQGESIRNAAKTFGIAYSTLRRYVTLNSNVTDEDLVNKRLQPNYINQLVFNEQEEELMKEYIKYYAANFHGILPKDCRKLAYQLAKANDIYIPDNWQRDKMAGKDWFRGFRIRHQDLPIKTDVFSAAQASPFNREIEKSFFANLKTAMSEHSSLGNGCRLYSLDETAVSTTLFPQKCVGLKGKHDSPKATCGQKSILVTTCAIVSASGQALSPAFVFPRNDSEDVVLRNAPPGSLSLANPSGKLTSELFVEVLKHFIEHTAASPENPALLILDTHDCHRSIEALDMAKRFGVTILTLHPQISAKMQPLVELSDQFQEYYHSAIDSSTMKQPGQVTCDQMTIDDIAKCLGIAYARAMTSERIFDAFKKCGIFPLNPDVFSDIDGSLSDMTDTISENVVEAQPVDETTTSELSAQTAQSLSDLRTGERQSRKRGKSRTETGAQTKVKMSGDCRPKIKRK